jgi:hypothetical protein
MKLIDQGQEQQARNSILFRCEVMKMRAKGRHAMLKAKQRLRLRAERNRKRLGLPDPRKHMGVVDDAEYGTWWNND